MMRVAARVLVILASVSAAAWSVAAAQEPAPIRSFAAFGTTIYYRYACAGDVFALSLGAQSQALAGEASLYWEIWDSGAVASGQVEPVAGLNTLRVTAVGAPLRGGFPEGSLITTVPRTCAGQSLYLWAASGATRLPDGSPVVPFANAAELPLTLPK